MKFAAIVGLFLLLFSFEHSFANSPGPGSHSKSSKFIDRLGVAALKGYCQKHLLNLDLMVDDDRKRIIQTNARSSCFVVLYEFATGSGPSTRFLFNSHPYTNEFIKGPGFKWVLSKTVSFKTETDSLMQVIPVNNLYYSFSPLPFKPKTWAFGLNQHYKTLKQHNLPQFILGSFRISVDTLPNNLTRFTVTNMMSRKSLFLQIGHRVQRPLPLGTTRQVITIILSKAEISCLLNR